MTHAVSTRVTYYASDPANPTNFDAVLRGVATSAQVDAIRDRCDGGRRFLPTAIGLPGALVDGPRGVEEPWHVLASVSPSTLTPNVDMTVDELERNFRAQTSWPAPGEPHDDEVDDALRALRGTLRSTASERDRVVAILDVIENLSANQLAELRARVAGEPRAS